MVGFWLAIGEGPRRCRPGWRLFVLRRHRGGWPLLTLLAVAAIARRQHQRRGALLLPAPGGLSDDRQGLVRGGWPGDPELLTVKGRRLLEGRARSSYAGSLVSQAATRLPRPAARSATRRT